MKVQCTNLVKTYRQVRALDGLTLEIPEGAIVGLLGKNGQGKSTLIKLLAGVARWDEGELTLDGQQPGTATKAKVSWLPEVCGLDLSWSAGKVLRFWEEFFPDFNREKAAALMRQLHLDPGQKLREMSKGIREKLQLVLVMSRDADLYLLDEPMSGVDPVTRDEILDTILTGYRPGSTLLLSTHLIQDVERILDQVIFLDKGKAVLQEDADALRQRTGLSISEAFKRSMQA